MLIQKMFSWLTGRFFDQSWYSEAHHNYFGQMGYYGFKDERVGYWECEIIHDERVVSIILNSPTEEHPTRAHQHFVESLLNDLDKTIAMIKPMMLDKLAQWLEFDSNADWYQLFKLTAIEVPIDADVKNDWEISFECLVDKEGHFLTCHFQHGNPEFVTVDG